MNSRKVYSQLVDSKPPLLYWTIYTEYTVSIIIIELGDCGLRKYSIPCNKHLLYETTPIHIILAMCKIYHEISPDVHIKINIYFQQSEGRSNPTWTHFVHHSLFKSINPNEIFKKPHHRANRKIAQFTTLKFKKNRNFLKIFREQAALKKIHKLGEIMMQTFQTFCNRAVYETSTNRPRERRHSLSRIFEFSI